MEEKMKKRVFILLAFAVGASSVYAADNCSGGFTFQPISNSPGDVSVGKVTTWTSATSVSSDNTPYNGSGTCSGYTYEKDGKTFNSDVCVRVTSDGDSWGTVGTVQAGAKRGEWRATFGTGKFAENAGSTGWYEIVAADDKGGKGIWGGNCLGVK
jgi:hypothetical protein